MAKEKDVLRTNVGFTERQKKHALENGGYSAFAGFCMDYVINNVLEKNGDSNASQTSSQS